MGGVNGCQHVLNTSTLYYLQACIKPRIFYVCCSDPRAWHLVPPSLTRRVRLSNKLIVVTTNLGAWALADVAIVTTPECVARAHLAVS